MRRRASALVLLGAWVCAVDAHAGRKLPPLPAPKKPTPHAVARWRPPAKPIPPRAAPPTPVEPPAAAAPEPPTDQPDAPDTEPPSDDNEPLPPAAATDPASRYGHMGRATCLAEARKRTLPVVAVDPARGVLAPVRITGPLHGVSFHSAMPAAARKTSVYEIFDCRLVLALDDLAQVLAKHDVVEVVHMSAYRPPPAKGWRDGELGTRHTGALAIDAGTFVRKDGSKLNVEKDFHGAIGQRPCGEKTGPWPRTDEGVELRKITCEALDAKLFHVFLTPGFNWAHRNHFHMEVSAKGTHFYVR